MSRADRIEAALVRLLDDIRDAGEDRNPETGEEFDSVTEAREALGLPVSRETLEQESAAAVAAGATCDECGKPAVFCGDSRELTLCPECLPRASYDTDEDRAALAQLWARSYPNLPNPFEVDHEPR